MYKELKKRLLLLLVCGVIGTVSGQAVLKVGSNPYLINPKAVLDVESTTMGLLPPRMTKVQRDAIASPPAGLLVWCNDCNTSTEPVSGELSVYLGSGWAPFTILSGSTLTTGKKSDANSPVMVSATSATIKGVLVSNTGATPTETGVVWREIIGTDFATLPLLDNTGAAAVPTYKTAGTLVTTDGAAISVTIPTLTSTASSARPYYFRTYAKTVLGIGYGNPVIFNCAPPAVSIPVVTGGSTLLPTFAGTLTVNAGTPKGTVTEYGYCSGATTSPTTANNKVVLSTATTLAALDTGLDSETFTADPTVDLAVANYNVKAVGVTYFRYYVIANGVTVYSPQVNFTPVFVAPQISTPVVTASTSLLPKFSATMAVGAGTPSGLITEYGYCSGATTSPTTANSKVVLSTTTSLADLDTALDSETFTTDPTVDLAVENYNVTAFGTTYFRYYVIANGVTTYSPQATFAPVADAVTGGTAIATVIVDPISAAPKIGVASTSTFKANFTVTKAGTYASFVPGAATGATTGLTLSSVAAGNFALGAQSLTFSVSGTPDASLAGNSFAVPRIGTLSTGAITIGDITAGNAICNGIRATTVVPITSTTGKIWMDRNLGASRAGTGTNDYEAYGCLYQWGRGNDNHASVNWTSSSVGTSNGTTSTLAITDSPGNDLFITTNSVPYDWRSGGNNALWQGAAGINNPCPAGYRVPTVAELTAEAAAYSMTNFETAYTSPLKFVVAGGRNYSDGSFFTTGIVGYYWSSTVFGTKANRYYFHTVSANTYTNERAIGFSVRCLKD